MKVQIKEEQRAALTRAVVKVGKTGRGFVVGIDRWERVVITAAHCLPFLPPCHPFPDLNTRSYHDLLGPLGPKPPKVWAECLFADPIADIAVLGTPDNQELSDKAEAYEALVMGATPLLVADAPKQGRARERLPHGGKSIEHRTLGQGPALLLSLDGNWIECTVKRWGTWLDIEPDRIVVGGMSGSPIVSVGGRAIGLVSTNRQSPILMESLPPRLLREIPTCT
jgi:hypothetical protein